MVQQSEKRPAPAEESQGSLGPRPQKRQRAPAGPVVWWVRNDLRLEDNPVVRVAVGEALTDRRQGAAVFIFDPRFLDRSDYGRVTDPGHDKSIRNRKPVSFGARKCCALRARFWLQCVRALATELSEHGVGLLVCHGRPEEVLGALPNDSLVVCQQEPVSVEASDVEAAVETALKRGGGSLQRDWGAMSLYHREDLPFNMKNQVPGSYSGLGVAVGWKDIWSSAERRDGATPVRVPVPAPECFPEAAAGLGLPGLLPPDVLADDTAALQRLGYSVEEINEALSQEIPQGGEPAARAHFEAWLEEESDAVDAAPKMVADWDLPIPDTASKGGHDPLAWANLSRPDGWTKISHYLAVGCLSAREVLSRAVGRKNFVGVAHRLLWREWHRLNAIQWGRRLFWLQGPGRVEQPWSSDPATIEAWKLGRTGVPYIDACMRELRQTGWLAYKGRKTAGHFLVFDLGVDWRVGAFHYEDVLLDYDCAMNYGNWVTVARVDKPRYGGFGSDKEHADLLWKLSAEQANDPKGEYIRKWVPELARVGDEHVHTPWVMSEEQMAQSGCVIGKDYPAPLTGPINLKKTVDDPDAHPAATLEKTVGELMAKLSAKEQELAKLRKPEAAAAPVDA